MSNKEKLIVRMGIPHPKPVSRLLTFGIGLAAIVSLIAIGVVGGVNTVQQAYAQENSNACPEGYTRGERGTCVAPAIVTEPECPQGTIPNNAGTCDVVLQGEVRPFCPPFAPLDEETGLCTDPNGFTFSPRPVCEYSNGRLIPVRSFEDECPEIRTGQVVNPVPGGLACPPTGNFRVATLDEASETCTTKRGLGEPEPGDDEDEEVEV
jgi:hypothetical protein